MDQIDQFSPTTVVVHVPVNGATVILFLALVVFAALGCVHVWKQLKQHRCHCPLCNSTYSLIERIGAGGFGSVWLVKRKNSKESSLQRLRALTSGKNKGEALLFDKLAFEDTFVLKLVPVTDINDATEAQREARDLRYLRHRFVVRYTEDFLHIAHSSFLSGLTGRGNAEANKACEALGAPLPPQGSNGGSEAGLNGQMFVAIVMERCKCDVRRYIADVRKGLLNPHLPLLAQLQHSNGDDGGNSQLPALFASSSFSGTTIPDKTSKRKDKPKATASSSSSSSSGAAAMSMVPTPSKPLPHHLRYISEEIIVKWAAQLVSGLKYLAGRNFCHRDIKSQNLFLAFPAIPPSPVPPGALGSGRQHSSGTPSHAFPIGNSTANNAATAAPLAGPAPALGTATAPVNADELYYYQDDDDYRDDDSLGDVDRGHDDDNEANNNNNGGTGWDIGPVARKRGQSGAGAEALGVPKRTNSGGSANVVTHGSQLRRRRTSSGAFGNAASSSLLSSGTGSAGATVVDLSAVDDIKIGDFGLARSFTKARTVMTEAGTDQYKAPEAFAGGKRDGTKADIWSFGLVLVELMTLTFTWEREGSLGAQVLKGKDQGPLQRLLDSLEGAPTNAGGKYRYSPALRLLVKKCLTPDPDLRPSAEQLFRFKFLRNALSGRITVPSNRFQQQQQQPQTTATTTTTTLPPPAQPPLLVAPHAQPAVANPQPIPAVAAVPAAQKPAKAPTAPAATKNRKKTPLSPQLEVAGEGEGDGDPLSDDFIIVQQRKRGQHRSQSRPHVLPPPAKQPQQQQSGHSYNQSTGSAISSASLLSTDSFVATAAAPAQPSKLAPALVPPISPAFAAAGLSVPLPVPLPIALPSATASALPSAAAAAAVATGGLLSSLNNGGININAARRPSFRHSRRRESGGSHGSSRASDNDRDDDDDDDDEDNDEEKHNDARRASFLAAHDDPLNRSWQLQAHQRRKQKRRQLAATASSPGAAAESAAEARAMLRHASDGDDEGSDAPRGNSGNSGSDGGSGAVGIRGGGEGGSSLVRKFSAPIDRAGSSSDDDDEEEGNGGLRSRGDGERTEGDDATGSTAGTARWTHVPPHRRRNNKKQMQTE